MNEESKPTRRGCRPGCLMSLVLVFGVGLVLATGLLVWGAVRLRGAGSVFHLGCGGRAEGGEDEWPRMREVWASGDGAAKVVRIPLSGFIFFQEADLTAGDRGSTETTLRSIRRATFDPDVEAVILEIDSGGGGITASDILYHELCAFKQAQEGRVIVAQFGDVAASGAYYVALAADEIVAHPTTLTGSIGVLMQSINVKELANRIGIRDVTFKSGANKDMLNPLGEVTPEQRAMLQATVDALHARFVGLVAANRKLPEARVRALADGRVFLAPEAKELGLIDRVGYAGEAEEVVSERLNGLDLKVYRYAEETSILDLLHAPTLFGRGAVEGLLDAGGIRLLYRWPH